MKNKREFKCIIFWLIISIFISKIHAEINIYISPNGNDNNEGSLNKPFKTITKARDFVRGLSKTQPITIYLLEGDYPQNTALTFGPNDSGSTNFPIKYKNYNTPGSARIISSKPVNNWTHVGNGIYRTQLSSPVYAIFEDHVAGIVAREPDASEGEAEIGCNMLENGIDNSTIKFKSGQVTNFDYSDAIIHVWPLNWLHHTFPINQIDFTERTITMNGVMGHIPKPDSRYYIENAREFIDEPGEFYMDSFDNQLYYMPRGNIENVTISIPQSKSCLNITGWNINEKVEHLIFEGLTIAEVDSHKVGNQGWDSRGVQIYYANNIVLNKMIIENAGDDAVYVWEGTSNLSITNSMIRHARVNGYKCWSSRPENSFVDQNTPLKFDITNINITNNIIYGIGKIGLDAGKAKNVEISNNEIFDCKRNGMSIHSGMDYNIHHNDIYHVALNYRDVAAGIYLNSMCRNINIEDNRIHDIHDISHPEGSGSKAIYLDYDANSDINIIRNVMFNFDPNTKPVKLGGERINFSKNIIDNRGNNNSYQSRLQFWGGSHSIRWVPWLIGEEVWDRDMSFHNNIFIHGESNGPMFIHFRDNAWWEDVITVGYLPDTLNSCDQNIYYNPDYSVEELRIHNKSISQWKNWDEMDYDANSLFNVNPDFINIDNQNYNFKNESPALSMGMSNYDAASYWKVGINWENPYFEEYEQYPGEASLPVINNTSPSNGDSITEGDIKLSVEASSQNDLGKVNFYIDDNFLGSDFNSPFEMTISNLSVGSHKFKAKVFDALGNFSIEQVTFNVTETDTTSPNSSPVANDDTGETLKNVSVIINLTNNDTDVNGDSLSISTVTQAQNGTVTILSDSNINYTPNTDYIGADIFNYTVSDGKGGTNTANVTVVVTAPNTAPIANDDSALVDMNTTKTINLTNNDTDVDGDTLAIESVTQAQNGIVSIRGNRKVDYIPNTNYTGNDTFSYTVIDGQGGSDTANVNVTIVATNSVPVANNDIASIDMNTTATINLVSNDSDADGDTLFISSVTQGQNGSVVITNNQNIMYTPNVNFSGTDTFNYTLSDGQGGNDSANVTIDVLPIQGPITPKFHTGIIYNLNENWQTVNLPYTYNSMVVIGTPIYNSTHIPAVVRIKNANGNSFQIRAQNPSDLYITGISVSFIVIEEGVYEESTHGINMEAGKAVSSVTSGKKSSWTNLTQVTMTQSYNQPVVLGQVMTFNDPMWSTFWSNNGTQKNPAENGLLYVGKHVGEDSNTSRLDEILGYLIIETGSGDLDGIQFEALLGSKSVGGITNGLDSGYATPNNSIMAVASSCGMAGGDGGWPVLLNSAAVKGEMTEIVVDEDQINDSERGHTSERIGMLYFDKAVEINNKAPITLDQSISVASSSSINITLTATDADMDVLTFEVTATPSQGSLTGTAPNLIYTANDNASGSDSFIYIVKDDKGGADIGEISISILAGPENSAPIANNDSATVEMNNSININLLNNDSDVDDDSLYIDSITQGQNGTVIVLSNNQVNYTPNTNFSGTDSFSYIVSDGQGGSDTANVTVNIIAPNTAPVANNNSFSVNMNGSKTVNLVNNDYDADGDTLSIASVTQGQNGTVTITSNSKVNYTPNTNYSGTDSFSYTVSDGKGGSDTANVTVNIIVPNTAPVANNNSFSVNMNGSKTVNLVNNDYDADGDILSIASVTQGQNGTVTITSNNKVNYTPNTNYSGTDSFSYTVSDGKGGSDTANVTVNIIAPNTAPVASNDSASVNMNNSITINLVNNDSDADGDTLSIASVTQGQNGTVTILSESQIVYTPYQWYRGTDNFSYTVSDGRGGTDTANVSISVIRTKGKNK